MNRIALLIVSICLFSLLSTAQGWEQLGTGANKLKANDFINTRLQ